MYVQLDTNKNIVQVIHNIALFNFYGRTITGADRLSPGELANTYSVYRLIRKREDLRKFEIPSDSPPRYEFDLASYVVYEVYSYDLLPLNIIKAEQMNQVKTARDDKRIEGFAFKPKVSIIDNVTHNDAYLMCPSTRSEQTDVTAIITAYKLGIKPSGTATSWKVGTNCYIVFQDDAEILRFALTMDAFIQACFSKEASVCNTITTINDQQEAADFNVKTEFAVDAYLPVSHEKHLSLNGVVYYKPEN